MPGDTKSLCAPPARVTWCAVAAVVFVIQEIPVELPCEAGKVCVMVDPSSAVNATVNWLPPVVVGNPESATPSPSLSNIVNLKLPSEEL